MIIVNADDWGRSTVETDMALRCYRDECITSVSAMVFMADSERASQIALDAGIDVGLHLNFDAPFTGRVDDEKLRASQALIGRFLSRKVNRSLVYNPFLGEHFRYVYARQMDEFVRLYGSTPSHINGHHHFHLCANMLVQRIIPDKEKVRITFCFEPGEKGFLNRAYRDAINRWLVKRYVTVDWFYSVAQIMEPEKLKRAEKRARTSDIEVNTHPSLEKDFNFLHSGIYLDMVRDLEKGSYATLKPTNQAHLSAS